jgi:hypothetical protein
MVHSVFEILLKDNPEQVAKFPPLFAFGWNYRA